MIFNKKVKCMLILLFALLLQVNLNAFELVKGKFKQSEYPKDIEGYKEYFLSNQLPGDSFTYLKHNRGDNSYYAFNNEGIIYDVDMTLKTPKSYHFNESVINRWSLIDSASIMAGEQYASALALNELNSPPYTTITNPLYDYIAFEDGSKLIELTTPLTERVIRQYGENIFGCIVESPLRFGKINNTDTLVSIVNESIILSSPALKKSIFRLIYARHDEASDASYLDTFGSKKPNSPQYAAESGKDIKINRLYSAQRSYGKLFEGDFNQDQKQDLIMWRKAYKSRLMSDPIIGYELNAELLVHYQLENGEYQLQSTEGETVKGWLTAANLTWQKGFPSKSECAGQEGQFIPEMHDPLLNDPDVLK